MQIWIFKQVPLFSTLPNLVTYWYNKRTPRQGKVNKDNRNNPLTKNCARPCLLRESCGWQYVRTETIVQHKRTNKKHDNFYISQTPNNACLGCAHAGQVKTMIWAISRLRQHQRWQAGWLKVAKFWWFVYVCVWWCDFPGATSEDFHSLPFSLIQKTNISISSTSARFWVFCWRESTGRGSSLNVISQRFGSHFCCFCCLMAIVWWRNTGLVLVRFRFTFFTL